jgi:cytochrome c oxidase cbb3-type subunit 3
MNETKPSVLKKIALSTMLTPGAVPLFAQQQQPAPLANQPVLFWAMIGMIAVLAIVLVGLALLLKTTLLVKYAKPEPQTKDASLPRVLPVLLMLALTFGSNGLFAQGVSSPSANYDGIHPVMFYVLVTVIVGLLVLIAFLYAAIIRILKPQVRAEEVTKVKFLEKLNASVPMEQEKDVMLDHDYDGIRELDNNLPPWWKYGFYITIVFACIYLWRFHVSGSGKLQQAEYEGQLAAAEVEIAAYKEKVGNLVDESNVIALTDIPAIDNGKSLFTANCAACHGQLGEGGVGPNLTDNYWLHGGGVKNIFKTIKYGWPQKGMKAWEKDFGAKQIQEISSFILTLKGSNPPNAKEKQGELYEEAPVDIVPSDSSKAVTLNNQ